MRVLCLCVLAALIFPSCFFAEPGEEEIQKLRAEIAKLREENDQLKKELDRLLAPQAKFEQVFWLQSQGDKQGRLYLVLLAPAGDLRKQMETLGPYAAAAVKEAEKAPVKDPIVVFVLRQPDPLKKGSGMFGPLPDLVAGFRVKHLQDIAAAPPKKRSAMFLTPAWMTVGLGVPREAKQLQ